MYNSVIELLPKAKIVFRNDEGFNQKIYEISNIYNDIPTTFKEKFCLLPRCYLGLEAIQAGHRLGTHIDYKPRISNLLININNDPVTIVHSNKGTLEEHTIEPLEYFLVDVYKEHGCNEIYKNDITFLTINYHLPYNVVTRRLNYD